jgi:hypothetical protein
VNLLGFEYIATKCHWQHWWMDSCRASFLVFERGIMRRGFTFLSIVTMLSVLSITVFSADTRPTASAGLGQKEKSLEKALLTPSDFKFVRSYPFSADNQAAYGMGLTHRRVKGQLRFLTTSYSGKADASPLIEFALPQEVGKDITKLTNRWQNIWTTVPFPIVGAGDQYGYWWEDQGDENGRLWTTHCTDYPDDKGTKNTQCLAIRKLNADGTVGNVKGEYGFAGVGQRAIYGGVQPIPKWFRDKYDISQPYAVGWGGYTSRMAQGLTPSLGLMALAIPDVTTYPDNSVIPIKDFKIMADHRSGTAGRDWYFSKKPSTFDRGQRNDDVVNYYDGGDKRVNPSSPPTAKPVAGAQWLSPAPDGFGRFVWGDSYYNTGCWISGPNKEGFIVIGSFTKGKAYYQSSTLHNEGRHAELQIFDPNSFGRVLQKKMNPWNIQPTASKLLTEDLAPLGLLFPNGGNNPFGAVAGATFDSSTSHLYLWCPGVKGKNGSCLVVYKVNS